MELLRWLCLRSPGNKEAIYFFPLVLDKEERGLCLL